MTVGNSGIGGTLKYVTGYTGFSGDPAEQSGNYLVIKCDTGDVSGATIIAEIIGGDHGPVTLDPDGILVARIKNRSQKIKITATKEDYGTVEKVYDLASLILES